MESKEKWCNKCDDYRVPILEKWESSIAEIYDLECPICGEIFDRKVEQKKSSTLM